MKQVTTATLIPVQDCKKKSYPFSQGLKKSEHHLEVKWGYFTNAVGKMACAYFDILCRDSSVNWLDTA